MLKKYLFLVFVCLLASFVSSAQLKVGEKAPEIVITNWIKNVPKSYDLKGKFVIIDFWATWCAPCLESVPHMNDLVNKNKSRSNLVFLAITDEKVDKVNWILKRVQFSSVVVSDTTRKTFTDYKATSIPLCVVIDDKNEIRWVGHAAKLTNEAIDNIVEGKAVAPPEKSKSSLPEEVISRYNSLFSQYYKSYQDDNIKEYFKMEPLSQYRWGATVFRNGNGYRKEVVVGDSLIQRLSAFLDIADNQIVLPEKFVGSCVSYCYKSAVKNTSQDAMDTLLHQLNLSYTSGDSLMNVMQLEVVDKEIFEKFLVGPKPQVGHASNSDSYAAIDYDQFSKLTRAIQQKFKTVIVLKDSIPDKKMSITIQVDTMKNLIASFKAHGIKVSMTKKIIPVYRFLLRN